MSIKFSKPIKTNNAKISNEPKRPKKVKASGDAKSVKNVKVAKDFSRPKSEKIKPQKDTNPPKNLKPKSDSGRSTNIKFNGKSSRGQNAKFGEASSATKKSFKFKMWMLIPIILVLAIAITVVVFNAKKTAMENEVMQVSISSLPTKLVYYVGEEFSDTGFAVTTMLNNGISFTEGPEACTFSGFDSRFATSKQEITVTYGTHTFVFTVDIKERPRPISPLTEVSLIAMPKTEYKVGEILSVSGGVLLLKYEDGSSREIQLKYNHIYDFSTDKPAEKLTVSVLVEENGYLGVCTYDITVTE